MKELIERIEGAEGDSADLLIDALKAAFPAYDGMNRDERAAWFGRYGRLVAMTNAEAWLSAAEILVPEGCDEWNCEKWDTSGVYPKHVLATAWVKGAPRCYAATPALALAAAALKARGE